MGIDSCRDRSSYSRRLFYRGKMLEINKIHCGDCLEVMPEIPDKSIDMILCDLPYGITACEWDIPIPLDKLWEQYKRIIKDRGAIVLTGSQPFTSKLVMSNLEWFKYEWVWEKTLPQNFVHSKNRPMGIHENILIFSPGTTVHKNQSEKRMTYNPQMDSGTPYKKKQVTTNCGINHSASKANLEFVGSVSNNKGTRYPKTIVKISNGNNFSVHPTQKPVKLFEYLIRTYTDEGDTVLDNCIGSGTTAIAASNTGRRFIGIEKDPEYHAIALNRLDRETRQEKLFAYKV